MADLFSSISNSFIVLYWFNISSQPNLVMESGIHSSLHRNCHHQIIYAKIYLKVFYPPPYEHEIWQYQRANLIKSNKQFNKFLGKIFWKLKHQWSGLLILKKILIFFQTTFLMIQSLVMTEIHLGSTATSIS